MFCALGIEHMHYFNTFPWDDTKHEMASHYVAYFQQSFSVHLDFCVLEGWCDEMWTLCTWFDH